MRTRRDGVAGSRRVERDGVHREARDVLERAGVERERGWGVECGRRSRDEGVVEARLPTDRHFDAGRDRCVGHGTSP